MDEPFQTVDNSMKTQFACSFLFKSSIDFRDHPLFLQSLISLQALAFRGRSAHPHQSKRLWGSSQPVIRQEYRKSLQSNEDYSKDPSILFDTLHCLRPLTQFIDLNHTVFGRSRTVFDLPSTLFDR